MPTEAAIAGLIAVIGALSGVGGVFVGNRNSRTSEAGQLLADQRKRIEYLDARVAALEASQEAKDRRHDDLLDYVVMMESGRLRDHWEIEKLTAAIADYNERLAHYPTEEFELERRPTGDD